MAFSKGIYVLVLQSPRQQLWIPDLYDRLQLPVIPSMVQALQKEVEDRMKQIERRRTANKKQIRIRMKVATAKVQEARENG